MAAAYPVDTRLYHTVVVGLKYCMPAACKPKIAKRDAYLLGLSSSCPERDIERRDFSTGVDRWQLSWHHAKLGSFCVGLP